MNAMPVKYHLLKPPFLLQGSATTEFIYKIQNTNLSKNDIEELNTLSIDLKIKIIQSRRGKLKFEKLKSSIFNNNLMMLDSKMPHLLSEIILLSSSKNLHKIKDLIYELEKIDPLSYKVLDSIKIYNYKINEFFKGLALGLDSTNIWYGEPNLYEHLPVIKSDNKFVYFSDNRTTFIEALISHAEIEVKSTKIKHYNNENYLNLRFQINIKT